MSPELSFFLAQFSPVSPEEAQALMPPGYQALYCLYAEEDPRFYLGRTNGPKNRWKQYRGGYGSNWQVRLWLTECKERGIKVHQKFLAHTPANNDEQKKAVKTIEGCFILWGKEVGGEHCLNLMDGTRPLCEVREEARGRAISKALKGKPISESHRQHMISLIESNRGKTPWNKGKPLDETMRLTLPESEIVSRYLAGESHKKIAKSLLVTSGTILRRLRKNGVRLRRPGEIQIMPLPEDEISALYLAGSSLDDLAQKFSVSSETIASRLRKNGVRIRSNGESHRGKSHSEEAKRKISEASTLSLPEHEIYALHKAGETQQQIAKKFGVSPNTISQRLRKYRDLLSWGLGPGF